mmetsp:Transcript_20010/g.47811  ORF Transcript_20010/g.47811 Transcript_20010/m.47811 type:complete len:81 (+) Transcript_20010:433-675(+)
MSSGGVGKLGRSMNETVGSAKTLSHNGLLLSWLAASWKRPSLVVYAQHFGDTMPSQIMTAWIRFYDRMNQVSLSCFAVCL